MTDTGSAGPRVLELFRSDGIVPLFGSGDPDEVARAADAVAEAGLATLEVTLRAPGALDALGRVAARVERPGRTVVVGAGTVLDPEVADAAIDAGARFVFSPTVSAAIAERCRRRGVPYLPGCATPTEIHEALRLGCDTVKLFPATTIGGPAFLQAVRPVFPGVRAIPTGGVVPEVEVLRAWYGAGADAVGLGSWLFPSAVDGTDWERARARLRTAVASVAAARREGST